MSDSVEYVIIKQWLNYRFENDNIRSNYRVPYVKIRKYIETQNTQTQAEIFGSRDTSISTHSGDNKCV